MAKITMMRKMALFVLFFAILSFIFGLAAYLKTPEPEITKDSMTCKFSNDPTVVVFGYLSVAFLVAYNVTGFLSLFCPYKWKSIPPWILVKSDDDDSRCALSASIFIISLPLVCTGVAAATLLRGTITEQIHLSQHKVHHDLNFACTSVGGTGYDDLLYGTFCSGFSGVLWLLTILTREDVLHKLNDVNGAEI